MTAVLFTEWLLCIDADMKKQIATFRYSWTTVWTIIIFLTFKILKLNFYPPTLIRPSLQPLDQEIIKHTNKRTNNFGLHGCNIAIPTAMEMVWRSSSNTKWEFCRRCICDEYMEHTWEGICIIWRIWTNHNVTITADVFSDEEILLSYTMVDQYDDEEKEAEVPIESPNEAKSLWQGCVNSSSSYKNIWRKMLFDFHGHQYNIIIVL